MVCGVHVEGWGVCGRGCSTCGERGGGVECMCVREGVRCLGRARVWGAHGGVDMGRGEEGACACVCVCGEGVGCMCVGGGGRGSLRCKSVSVTFQS